MYKRWYVEKKRPQTHECVKRCKMRKVVLMAKEAQVDKDYEIVTFIDAIMSRSLDMYARQSHRIIAEI